MEFIVCMLLAGLLGAARPVVDGIHAVKGTTPPHLEKARLKAQQSLEKAKLKAQPGGTQTGKPGRSPFAADKPRLRDVAAVYVGDTMADAIDLHNRRRDRKRNPSPAGPAGEKRQPFWKQIRDLLIRPVGDPKPAEETALTQAQPEQIPTWTCEGCDLRFTGEPTPSRLCTPCGKDFTPTTPPRGRSTRTHLYALGTDNCVTCGNPGEVVEQADGRTFVHKATGGWCPAIEGRAEYEARQAPVTNEPVRPLIEQPEGDSVSYQEDVIAEKAAVQAEKAAEQAERDRTARANAQYAGVPYQGPAGGHDAASNTAGGSSMAQNSSAGSATGEAVNYETAMAELDALEQVQQQHLDQALAAQAHAAALMESVSNTQATYRPAADAGANTHQALDALHLDQETVAQTGNMVDAMPPNRVDEIFTQIEGLKADIDQQVANAEAALQATRNARTSITAKYGDAHATVAGDLSGDSRFLSSSAT